MDGRKLADYTAASIPLHLTDGWVLLARAAGAITNGDWAGAIHFAYYAELRAAMALLACQGVLVLNDKHVCLDTNGNPHVIQGRDVRTHRFTWAALDTWQSWPSSMASIHGSIVVERHSIAEWLQAAGVQPAGIRGLEKRWLRDWSLDLKDLAGDQELRNEASYRPTRMSQVPKRDFSNSVAPFVRAWSIWEPGGAGRLPDFDRELLRMALDSAFRSKVSRAPRGPNFESFIDRTCTNIGVNSLREFLVRGVRPNDHELFLRARPTKNTDDPLPVFARAAILLRLASACGSGMMQSAGIRRADVEFWLGQFGEDNALWDENAAPDVLTDLWADVGVVVDDLSRGRIAAANPAASLLRAWSELSGPMHAVSKFERLGLWALGL